MELFSAKIKKQPKEKDYNPPLFYYGHFITDCLIPDLLQQYNRFNLIYRINTWGETLGYLKPIYEQVMNCSVIEVSEKEYDNLNVPEFFTYPIKDVKKRITKSNVKKFKDHIFLLSTLHPTHKIKTPKVIFIKRGNNTLLQQSSIDNLTEKERSELETHRKWCLKTYEPSVYSSHESFLHTPCNTRRDLPFIDEIDSFLLNTFSDEYESVILENLSFWEQIQYFKNAKIIIGCHGAGFTNTIFCSEHSICIEYIPSYLQWNSFRPFFKKLNLQHYEFTQFIELKQIIKSKYV